MEVFKTGQAVAQKVEPVRGLIVGRKFHEDSGGMEYLVVRADGVTSWFLEKDLVDDTPPADPV